MLLPSLQRKQGKSALTAIQKFPKKGDKDLYLTELGTKFKENGNKLPGEKK